MAQIHDLILGRRVECDDGGVMHGARGTIQKNGAGLYKMPSGHVWVVWDNPQKRIELSPAWIGPTFVKVIKE
jgi:hypothetical protein